MADIEQAPQQTETADEKAVHCPQKSQIREGKDARKRDENEVFLVAFSPDDLENPQNWSKKTKVGVTAALSATGFNRIMLSTVSLTKLLQD